jgi:DNA-binding CsgD family transcriptional regulator
MSLVLVLLTSPAAARKGEFRTIADSLDALPAQMYDAGKSLLHSGFEDNSCETIFTGGALMLRAINNGWEAELPEVNIPSCDSIGVDWAQEWAYYHFEHQNFEKSRVWYERVLQLAETDRERAKAQNNIGVTHHFEGNLEAAYDAFERAVDYGIENLSSINLASIAGLSNTLGQPHACLDWTQRAMERLDQELKDGMPLDEHARRFDLISLSELMAHLDLKQVDDARQVFSRMQMRDAFPGLEMEFAHASMILALRADDPSVLEVHRPQMETWMAADSAEAVARLGASVMYFEPWRTDWMEATGLETDQIWPHLTSLSPHLLPVLNPERVHDTPVQRAETAYRSASWLLLIIGLLPLLVLVIFKQVHQNRSLYSNHQLISDIDRVYRNPKLMGRMSGALSRAVWLGRQALKAVPDGLLEQLTTREREILKAAQINERPKLTADRLGIAPKSIYTLRTTLRSKLDIPRELSLEDWAQQHLIEKP